MTEIEFPHGSFVPHSSILDGWPCPHCEWGLIRESQPCPTCTDAATWRNYLDNIGEDEDYDCPDCYGTKEIVVYETCATCAGTGLVSELPFSVPAAQLRLPLQVGVDK